MGRKATAPEDVKVGSVHEMKQNGTLIVTSYVNNLNVGVEFVDTGFKSMVNISQIRKGTVKDKLKPTVFGVGFFGDGPHPALVSGKPTKAYNTWRHMLGRCYDKTYQIKTPTYTSCMVCKEWHNFQNFASWFNDKYQEKPHKQYLDKDLKVIGNKVYSPDTCLLVSSAVNGFLTDRTNHRGNYMIGVGWHSRDLVFSSNCNDPISSNQVHLGYFKDEASAHSAWRKFKSQSARSLAKIQDNEEVRAGLIRYANAIDNYEIYSDGYEK